MKELLHYLLSNEIYGALLISAWGCLGGGIATKFITKGSALVIFLISLAMFGVIASTIFGAHYFNEWINS